MDIKKAWKSAHAARSSTGAFALPVKENEEHSKKPVYAE